MIALSVVTTACHPAEAMSAAAPSGVQAQGDLVVVPVRGGTATVRPSTLEVTATPAGGPKLILSDKPVEPLGAAGSVAVRGDRASWSYPDGRTVTAHAEDGRLVVSVRVVKDGHLTWPIVGTDPAASSIEAPFGEGLSIPVADPEWNRAAPRISGMTMPFWGYTAGKFGVSYLVPTTDIDTDFNLVSSRNRVRGQGTHAFSNRSQTATYTVHFSLTDSSPVAAARDYRDWLVEHGAVVTLKEKIRANPDVRKLLGAFHAYLWGKPNSADGIKRLRELGLSRILIGTQEDGPMKDEVVRAAKAAGYLVGPYDTWDNAQDPATADNPLSTWPDKIWPDACVRKADGQIQTGFGGRGCYLSSQALAQAEPEHQYLAKRLKFMKARDLNSYFLDVDATSELFDDYSAEHPMTKTQDRQNRLHRMRTLLSDRGIVLGSETAMTWANPVLAFNYGSSTPIDNELWDWKKKNKDVWGYAPMDWRHPEEGPKVHFAPADVPTELRRTMFDPAFRIPLYQTVLHDSVVGLDRAELTYNKLPHLRTQRALQAILTNTPLLFNLNEKDLATYGSEMVRLQQYFAPLHEAAGAEPMTGFERLTSDKLLQRSTFGRGVLTVTANFGTTERMGVPGGCVDAKLRSDPAPRRLCPTS